MIDVVNVIRSGNLFFTYKDTTSPAVQWTNSVMDGLAQSKRFYLGNIETAPLPDGYVKQKHFRLPSTFTYFAFTMKESEFNEVGVLAEQVSKFSLSFSYFFFARQYGNDVCFHSPFSYQMQYNKEWGVQERFVTPDFYTPSSADLNACPFLRELGYSVVGSLGEMRSISKEKLN